MAKKKKENTAPVEDKATNAVENLEANTKSSPLGSEPEVDTSNPPIITVNDIQTMLAVINTASSRGGFEGAELKTVGELHDKLVHFLKWAAQATTDNEPTSE
jgi:hypothetical protein